MLGMHQPGSGDAHYWRCDVRLLPSWNFRIGAPLLVLNSKSESEGSLLLFTALPLRLGVTGWRLSSRTLPVGTESDFDDELWNDPAAMTRQAGAAEPVCCSLASVGKAVRCVVDQTTTIRSEPVAVVRQILRGYILTITAALDHRSACVYNCTPVPAWTWIASSCDGTTTPVRVIQVVHKIVEVRILNPNTAI